MKHMLKKQALLLIAVFNLYALYAQDSGKVTPVKPFTGLSGFRTFSIGINGGALAPVVAIGGSNDFSKWKPTIGYGFYIKNQFTHYLGAQAEFLRGTLKGDNSKKLGDGTLPDGPYTSFKTDLNWAASLSAVFNFGNINWVSEKTPVIPYISIGGGWANYKPFLVAKGSSTEVPYKASGSIKEFFIPAGFGIKIIAAPGINIDLGHRMNFVDASNLDGYDRGISKDKFSYSFVGLEFALGNKSKPQLMTHNPAAQLQRDLQDENMALRNSVSTELAKGAKANEETLAKVSELQQELDKFKQDSDNDGVSDYFDKCPNTPAGDKVDGKGCTLPKPEVPQPVIITEEDKRIVREAIKNLEFDLGKVTIRSSSYESLDKVAEILVKKNFSLKLAGHTDNIGSDEANLRLSKDRAESVKAYLVSKGANPSRIEATGYGESQPIASNKTAEGRQKNRRVEFTLY